MRSQERICRRPSSPASNTLKDLVNDILDLALVESGALRLELERIDLYGLLGRCRHPCRRMGRQDGSDAGAGLRARRRRLPGRSSGACARSCSIFCPTPSNSRRAAARIILSGRIVGEDVQIAVRRQWPGPAAGRESQCVRALLGQEPVRASAPARAWAWRWSTASWNCMTAGWRSKAAQPWAARWCAATCPRRIHDTPTPDERTEGGQRVAYL